MARDLTTSNIERKNILNNKYALDEIYTELGFPGVYFDDSYRFTKRQVADLYGIDERTVERYLVNHRDELEENGYEILSGKRLSDFKDALSNVVRTTIDDASDIDVGTIRDTLEEVEGIKNTSVLGVFTFKALLNIGMLLTESQKAKMLRAFMLDIVIDTLNKKIGGNTKYINQREEEFLPSAIREFNYREAFTNALDIAIEKSKYKYPLFTNLVYQSIFNEDAKEYRQILKLRVKEAVPATLYSEVLDIISSYENGFAEFLKEKYQEKQRKLTVEEAKKLFSFFESKTQAIYEPLIEKARTLMASRDMAFRDALHEKLKHYITHLPAQEFDKFLGEKSLALEERIKKNIDVFKRLKER